MLKIEEARFKFEVKPAAVVPFLVLLVGMSPRFGLRGAMLAAMLFYASLLAHEVAHMVVAKATGTRVSALGLSLWGAFIRRAHARDAASEVAIASAGPLMNLALAFALWSAGGMLFWLAQMNVLLFVLNMLPVKSSDGQRILRTIKTAWISPAPEPVLVPEPVQTTDRLAA